jgi:hypothetical protein
MEKQTFVPPTHTLAGFDLSTHSSLSSAVGGDVTTRPLHQGVELQTLCAILVGRNEHHMIWHRYVFLFLSP